jgi:hypothetical protein
MPRKQSAHARLDALRQRVATEGMKQRDAAALLEASKAKVEDAASALTNAYAAEDAKLVQQRRKELEQAEAEVLEAQHRVNGAELRAQQAKQELDEFTRDNARSVLDEREQTARAVAADLTRKVHEVVKAHKAYTAERQHVDQLVAAVPGASVRADGVPSGYAWQDALRTLERVVGEHPEAELPRPRWLSVSHREHQDEVHRRLQLRRQKRTAELDEAA